MKSRFFKFLFQAFVSSAHPELMFPAMELKDNYKAHKDQAARFHSFFVIENFQCGPLENGFNTYMLRHHFAAYFLKASVTAGADAKVLSVQFEIIKT